ncbi:hypothetical protein KCP71_25700 [Salmonella enterica subsp. enterica]|nr:hypothetical protein KCP71_25700 [Salmonella enterica subsp. enterica]
MNIAPFITLTERIVARLVLPEVESRLGSRLLFVKPRQSGLSVGVSKVANEAHISRRSRWLSNSIIKCVCDQRREIECAVLGNDNLIAPVPAAKSY